MTWITGGAQMKAVENQFLMSLMKLRKHYSNQELAMFFAVSDKTLSKIFITWINFMYFQWKELNMWPSKDLVAFFTPADFTRKFARTRIIVDGTEIPIRKPKDPDAQQKTWSTYKNANTLKVLVGCTPGPVFYVLAQCELTRFFLMFFSELAHCKLSRFLSIKRETTASSDWAHSQQAPRQLLAVFELAPAPTKSSSGDHLRRCKAREAAQGLPESTGGPGWQWRTNPQPFSPVLTSNDAHMWFGGPNDNTWNGIRHACTPSSLCHAEISGVWVIFYQCRWSPWCLYRECLALRGRCREGARRPTGEICGVSMRGLAAALPNPFSGNRPDRPKTRWMNELMNK